MPDEARGPRAIGRTGYALVIAVLALVTSAASVVFTFWPELRPDPRESLGAQVSVATIEPSVAYGDWVDRTARDERDRATRIGEFLASAAATPGERVSESVARRLLRQRGSVAYVTFVAQGFKRRNVVLRWSLYDRTTRRRVPARALHDVQAADVDLEAPTDRSVVQLWIPPYPGTRSVFVRVEVRSRSGALLAFGDSRPFSGLP